MGDGRVSHGYARRDATCVYFTRQLTPAAPQAAAGHERSSKVRERATRRRDCPDHKERRTTCKQTITKTTITKTNAHIVKSQIQSCVRTLSLRYGCAQSDVLCTLQSRGHPMREHADTLPPFVTLRACGLALMHNGGANPVTDDHRKGKRPLAARWCTCPLSR